jgi:hypothetical protein
MAVVMGSGIIKPTLATHFHLQHSTACKYEMQFLFVGSKHNILIHVGDDCHLQKERVK